MITTIRLSGAQVTQLVELLTVTAAAAEPATRTATNSTTPAARCAS